MGLCVKLVLALLVALASLGGFVTWYGGPDAVLSRLIPQVDSEMKEGVVLISGCSSGIGYHTAERLGNIGFYVVAGVRTQKDFERLKTKERVFPVIWDVTNDDQTKTAFEYALIVAKTRNVKLQGVILNAATSGEWGWPFEWLSMDVLKQIFDINVFGAARITYLAIPELRKNKGRIIAISSVASRISDRGNIIYSSTKGAMDSFYTGLRRELFRKVSVSIINPGGVKTDFYINSQRSYDRLLAKNATDPNYASMVELNGKYRIMDLIEEQAGHVDETVDTIVHALTSKYPMCHYWPGKNFGVANRIHSVIFWLLPARLMDFTIAEKQLENMRNDNPAWFQAIDAAWQRK